MKIVLDPAGSGRNKGREKGGRGAKEKNLTVCLAVREGLVRCGVDAVMTRETDENKPLEERRSMCVDADFVLSVDHVPRCGILWAASEDPPARLVKDKALAACLEYVDVKRGYPENRRGDFAINKGPEHSALLQLPTGGQAGPEAIVKGICAAMGVDYLQPEPKRKKSDEKEKQATEKIGGQDDAI
ncbi:N-acetylmuramoyl-L-alanine amidase [Ruminococcaceae bacterium OttesenSCG-928-I18]|nr:N-acetylmuramoyl-L-alanine amidase [Ruminococcaceae bacterium OttesenSCG-928-I18]